MNTEGTRPDEAGPGPEGTAAVVLRLWQAVLSEQISLEEAVEQVKAPTLQAGCTLEQAQLLAAQVKQLEEEKGAPFRSAVLARLLRALADSFTREETVRAYVTLSTAALGAAVQGGLEELFVAGCREGLGVGYYYMDQYQVAINCFQAALEVYQRRGLELQEAQCRMNRSLPLQSLGRYEEALEGYQSALIVYQRRRLDEEVALCRMNRGLTLHLLGRYEEALKNLDSALEVYQRRGLHVDSARCRMNRANTLHRLGRYGEALKGFQAALDVYQRQGFELEKAQCRQNLAITLHCLGRYGEALEDYQAALKVFQRHGLQLQEAKCQADRGLTLQTLDRYGEALESLQAALDVFRRHGLDLLEAQCQLNRGVTLLRLGRYGEALESFQVALDIHQQHDLDLETARSQMHRGLVLQSLGRYGEALEDFQSALKVFQQHGLNVEAACCRDLRAVTLLLLGRYKDALEDLEAALKVFQQYGLDVDAAKCWGNWANTQERLGRYEEALKGLQAALEVFQRHGLEAEVAKSRMNQAVTLESLGRCEEACAELEQIPFEIMNPEVRCRYHSIHGETLWKKGQVGPALEQFRAARCLYHQSRITGGITEENLDYLRTQQDFLSAAVNCGLDSSEVVFAYGAVQDGKANLLGDQFTRRNGNTNEEPADVGIARKSLTDWMRRRRGPAPATANANPVAEQRALLDAYLKVWRTAHPSASSTAEPRDDVATLESVQRALPADWALLDFWRTGDDEVTVFLVTRNDLRPIKLTVPLGSHEELQQHWAALLRWQQHPDTGTAELLDDLGHLLFRPLLPHLRGIHGLYLVPHRFLHAVPLHACQFEENGVFIRVAERFRVAYLPSATLLPQLCPVRWNQRLWSMTNPELGTIHTLPFSFWESRNLSRAFAGEGHQFHLHDQALFDNTAGWGEAGLVHFSCHGLGSEVFAPLSRLSLYDDYLLAHDVVYRRPPLAEGALVVLNGCETGVRDWRAVDEGMGLMSAFLLRGAGLVLATQWSVHDAFAAEVVGRFVHHWTGGKEPTDALELALKEARSLSTDEVLDRCKDVLRLFPSGDHPHEALQLCIASARVCHRAGRLREFDEFRRQAESLCERLYGSKAVPGLHGWLTRAELPVPPSQARITFDDPSHWAAFQLVGRVT